MATRFTHEQLQLKVNATHADHQIDISARYVQIGHFGFKDPAITVDLAASGLGGLDTGSEAADTWYNIYLITDARGSAINAVMSVATTVPTYPAGYTDSVYVGAVRNNAAGAIWPFINAAGSNVFAYDTDTTVAPFNVATLGSLTFTTVAAATCQKVLPPKCRRALLFGYSVGAAAGYVTMQFRSSAVTAATNVQYGELIGTGGDAHATSLSAASVHGFCNIASDQTFQYRTQLAADSGVVFVLGYEDIR